jgi:hypothetical protein
MFTPEAVEVEVPVLLPSMQVDEVQMVDLG